MHAPSYNSGNLNRDVLGGCVDGPPNTSMLLLLLLPPIPWLAPKLNIQYLSRHGLIHTVPL